MGEYADMFINGLVDAETGEFLDGEAPGYPRVRRKGKVKPQFSDGTHVTCLKCGKKCKGERGLRDHTRDRHGETK